MLSRFINKIAVAAASLAVGMIVSASGADAADFTFVAEDGLQPVDYAHIEDALNESRASVLSSLGLTELQGVVVRIWHNEELYQDAMEATFGARAPGSRGYVYGDSEIRLLLTDRPTAAREAVHEFVHAASLNLNPEFGNNPRWLWEAVAIYTANETPHAQTIFLFQNGKCPSLASLNEPFNRGGSIYDVGYYLMEFVASEWNQAAIVDLVKTNGDIEAVLGIDTEAFETQWCSFVRGKYSS
ncbi:gluzincin family metallopeptidase [Kordiimonas aquimaris]|uniref:hypothetical protein n=1 Tax=Kordiimonas aquimaris TaxID=707591 RepID=UPI0021D32BF9|nr:hypothetical protein [Kordiimonas aquimaris]